MITFDGKTQSLTDWAKETGIQRSTLSKRIHRDGWPVEKALTTTPGKARGRRPTLITHNGKTRSITAWARETGIPRSTLSKRIHRDGWPVEKALTTPLGESVGVQTTLITYNGKTQSLSAWAEELGIDRSTLSKRINRQGWAISRAFGEAVQPHRKLTEATITAHGRTQTVAEWSAEYNLPASLIINRIERLGWTPEYALSIPTLQQRKQENTHDSAAPERDH